MSSWKQLRVPFIFLQSKFLTYVLFSHIFKVIIYFQLNQGRYIRRTTIFIFSLCVGLVTQLNGSALGVLKHHYITKRIRELLIGNSRFLIYNSLNQLLYYTIQKKVALS